MTPRLTGAAGTPAGLGAEVCCDETPIRVGPAKAKKYLLVACGQLLTWYMLGGRDLGTFKRFVLADLTGVVVHDRYQNYDAAEFGGRDHQLCTAHLLRNLEDCAETYPDARWPRQLQMALRGLIHAANLLPRQKTRRRRYPPRRTSNSQPREPARADPHLVINLR